MIIYLYTSIQISFKIKMRLNSNMVGRLMLEKQVRFKYMYLHVISQRLQKTDLRAADKCFALIEQFRSALEPIVLTCRCIKYHQLIGTNLLMVLLKLDLAWCKLLCRGKLVNQFKSSRASVQAWQFLIRNISFCFCIVFGQMPKLVLKFIILSF